MSPVRISRHAVERYISRVDPAVSPSEARVCVARILALGRSRSTPRHWMRSEVRLTPGLRFVYWSEQPHVCLLVLDGVVITTVTRSLYRRRRLTIIPRGEAEPIYAAGRRPVQVASRAGDGLEAA